MRRFLVPRYQRLRLGLLLGTLLAVGCSEEATGPRPVPAAVVMVGGEEQVGTVGRPLDSTLTVLVTDKFGEPVPGVLVRFATSGKAGSLAPITQTTGPEGRASARWTLPTVTGVHAATARVSGLDSLVFHAVAAPAAPASLSLLSGDLQTAATAGALATAVVVLIRDGYGNPVGGAPVSFVPTAGGGSAEPAATLSDSVGHARTSWTLGEEPGEHALIVHVDTLPDLRVRAHALTRLMSPGYGVPIYYDEASLSDSGAAGSGGVARTSGRAIGSIPALECWQNALGSVSLVPGQRTGEDLPLQAPGAAGCEEPAAF